MFFTLFILFEIFYSINCHISCYQTRDGLNTFDYMVTVDHFPTELKNVTIENNSGHCMIRVIWQRDPHTTDITLMADMHLNAVSKDHQLQIDVGYENIGSITIWEELLIYQCNTDNCNNLNQLKRLLNSLTMNDNLIDLVYLLVPTIPFHGEWCYRASNSTFQTCNITIPNNLCKQCQLTGIMNQTRYEICATCSIDNPDKYTLTHGKTFNLIDRTESTLWIFTCGREDCDIPNIGDKIREKSHIQFDFNKFLNNQTGILSMNKVFLLFIIFFNMISFLFK